MKGNHKKALEKMLANLKVMQDVIDDIVVEQENLSSRLPDKKEFKYYKEEIDDEKYDLEHISMTFSILMTKIERLLELP